MVLVRPEWIEPSSLRRDYRKNDGLRSVTDETEKPLSVRLAELRVKFGVGGPEKATKRHPDDYTALSNWLTHDEVKDSEISFLVVRLADHGMRVAEIEAIMKEALREQLKIIEMYGSDEEET